MIGRMQPRRRRTLQVASWIATVALGGCGGSPAAEPDAGRARVPDAAPATYTSTTLQTIPYVLGTRTFSLHLVRIDRPDGGRTYVEWIPSDVAGARPAMILTEPYTGIDWTGEALDTRWAATAPQPDGLYLDVDGPAFDGSNEITYDLKSPADAATDATIHLLDNFGAVEIFGRYYAGGSVRDDVADMAAGMWFAAEQPEIDPTRIGIFGASWGGFEALFAAQQADPRARPLAVAAGFPVSDFATEATHAATREAPAAAFFQSYLHRIYAATGGPPTQASTDYTGLGTADLCAALPPATLVLHDEADDLVPIAETHALVSACGVTPMFWDRTAPPDPGAASHGPITDEPGLPSWTTFATTYVHRRIQAADQQFILEVYSPAALLDQLATAHTAQGAARDVRFEAPRLLELCDPLVNLIDIDTCGATCPTEPGAAVVARLVNQTWGTSFTAATIAAQLQTGLPR